MRLIDADELMLQFDKDAKEYEIEEFHIDFIADIVSDAQEVDAVEVVRCKDYKYFGEYNTLTQHWTCCTYWSGDPYEQATIEATDFCSCGERSEE